MLTVVLVTLPLIGCVSTLPVFLEYDKSTSCKRFNDLAPGPSNPNGRALRDIQVVRQDWSYKFRPTGGYATVALKEYYEPSGRQETFLVSGGESFRLYALEFAFSGSPPTKVYCYLRFKSDRSELTVKSDVFTPPAPTLVTDVRDADLNTVSATGLIPSSLERVWLRPNQAHTLNIEWVRDVLLPVGRENRAPRLDTTISYDPEDRKYIGMPILVTENALKELKNVETAVDVSDVGH